MPQALTTVHFALIPNTLKTEYPLLRAYPKKPDDDGSLLLSPLRLKI
jgi:hypothetical protein